VQNPIDEPEPHFSVRGDRRNGVDRLTLVGELDRSSVAMLEGELEHVAHAGGALIIDLRDLDTVDEAGVLALEATAQQAGRYG
jgi:anti-anti-sigma regulatory factor